MKFVEDSLSNIWSHITSKFLKAVFHKFHLLQNIGLFFMYFFPWCSLTISCNCLLFFRILNYSTSGLQFFPLNHQLIYLNYFISWSIVKMLLPFSENLTSHFDFSSKTFFFPFTFNLLSFICYLSYSIFCIFFRFTYSTIKGSYLAHFLA